MKEAAILSTTSARRRREASASRQRSRYCGGREPASSHRATGRSLRRPRLRAKLSDACARGPLLPDPSEGIAEDQAADLVLARDGEQQFGVLHELGASDRLQRRGNGERDIGQRQVQWTWCRDPDLAGADLQEDFRRGRTIQRSSHGSGSRVAIAFGTTLYSSRNPMSAPLFRLVCNAVSLAADAMRCAGCCPTPKGDQPSR